MDNPITIKSLQDALNKLREEYPNPVKEMYMRWNDREYLMHIIKPGIQSYVGKADHVASMWGVNIYTDESIPNNTVKVVNSDGTVQWMKLREDK